MMLDLSKVPTIKDSLYFHEDINQLYHPTGLYPQDSQNLVYAKDTINHTNFGHILLKEWFYLVKKDGYLIIDYKPNKVSDFRKLEKDMWWLWKGNYEIIFHGLLEEKHTVELTEKKLLKFIQEVESYFKLNLDKKTKLPKAITTKQSPDTETEFIRFVCKKVESTKIEKDAIDKWTFGIVTRGDRMDWLMEIIESIRNQKIPNYEIIICGEYPHKDAEDIVYIPFNQRDDLGWITRKKNLIVKKAKYQNLCIIHDRAIFPKDWYTKMKEWGNCFEIMCNQQLHKGMRAYDWTTLGGSLGTEYKMLLLDYRDWDWYSVIGGMQIISKKHILLRVPLDETRYWNEAEDVELTFNLRDSGYIARINNAVVETLGFRHGLIPSRPYNKRIYIPDLLLRRTMRFIARLTLRIPVIHSFLQRFCKTKFYRKIIKLE